jgi:hypothetical protein
MFKFSRSLTINQFLNFLILLHLHRMAFTPKQTAPIATLIPGVWSDNPTFKPNLFFKKDIALKFTSSYRLGYEDVHFNSTISLFPTNSHASTALSHGFPCR